MGSSDETNFASSSMKIPIFDGVDRTRYQEWEDDILAILQYHDLEEYVEEGWKGKAIPAKTETDSTKILQRKEMKKAKAIFVRATRELPNMIVKECQTLYESFVALREKYAVQKVREDFDVLDDEWNQFVVTDISTDPDLIFKTLEEQSKKLKVFGERYAKDSLQTLSKLKRALPSDYDHVFTYLNTSEERQKSFDEQLVTAKAMISSHYKTKILGIDKKGSSMICMIANNPPTSNSSPTIVCDFCKKSGHPKMKNGKPFCFKYKKWLKKKQNNKDDTSDVNSLFVTCVTTDDMSTKSSTLQYDRWLGDTGAQCHVRAANKSDTGTTSMSVKMGNNTQASVLKKEDIVIKDELGTQIRLNDTRVVKGMTMNVISLLQLVEEGWNMTTKTVKGKKYIYMNKNGNRVFSSQKNAHLVAKF